MIVGRLARIYGVMKFLMGLTSSFPKKMVSGTM
jgi:hypothetical protein